MKIYSDFPLAKSRQVLGDVIAGAAVIASIVLGISVHAVIVTFADLGRQLESAGSGFRSDMADAADAIGDIPLVGDGARSPFDSASGAGGVLEQAGINQQHLVANLAIALGVIVAIIPILLVVRYWLVRRVRFARIATATRNLALTQQGLDLLALRALVGGDPATVLRAVPDAAARWRANDPRVLAALASLSLRDAGVKAVG